MGCARRRPRGGAPALAADRQAYQCRVSYLGLDSAGQYHDAGTAAWCDCDATGCAASSSRDQRADHAASRSGTSCCKKTDYAESASGCAGSAVAGTRIACARARARGE